MGIGWSQSKNKATDPVMSRLLPCPSLPLALPPYLTASLTCAPVVPVGTPRGLAADMASASDRTRQLGSDGFEHLRQRIQEIPRYSFLVQ